ncbi:uncharacterized protein V6R79_000149 [Siganus canaliculatus]
MCREENIRNCAASKGLTHPFLLTADKKHVLFLILTYVDLKHKNKMPLTLNNPSALSTIDFIDVCDTQILKDTTETSSLDSSLQDKCDIQSFFCRNALVFFTVAAIATDDQVPMPGTSDEINVLGVLVFSIVFGLILGNLKNEGKPLKDIFDCLNKVTMHLIGLVLWYSPVGIIFLVAGQILNMKDAKVLGQHLAMYTLTVITGLIIHSFVTLPIIYVAVTHKNPFTYVANLHRALSTACGTSSRAVTLPITIHFLENNLNLDNELTRFMLPTAATMTMDGTALYKAVASIFIAQFCHVDLDLSKIIIIRNNMPPIINGDPALSTMDLIDISDTQTLQDTAGTSGLDSPPRNKCDIKGFLGRNWFVFFTIAAIGTGMSSIDKKAFGKMGLWALGYYALTTFMAVFTGVVLVVLIQPGKSPGNPSAPSGGDDAVQTVDAILDMLSVVTLPITIHCLENNLNVDKNVISFMLPTAAVMTMDGTALYEAVASIFIAQFYDVYLDLGKIILIRDRLRTMTNVLGDSIGVGVVQHLCRNELQRSTTKEECFADENREKP